MISSLDHLVLTVADIQATCDFYTRALGMTVETFGEGRVALRFGDQKINLHPAGNEFEPKAKTPTPGSGDLCFLTSLPLAEAEARIRAAGVEIEVPASPRTGATGPILSIYFRDPDGNLIEVSEPLDR